MSLSQAFLDELDQELPGTRKALERLPEDRFGFKPHEKSGTLIWLADHVATICDWGYTTLTTPELVLDEYTPPPAPATTAELLKRFDQSSEKFRDALSKASDDDMRYVWSMTFKGQKFMEMPRSGVIRSVVLNHLIHHRGQLTVYMRLLGVPVPPLYGPTADEGSMGAGA